MRVVCQYCRTEIRREPGGDLVSHDICERCAPHMEEEFMATRSVALKDLLSRGAINKLVPILNAIQDRVLDISAGKARIMEVLEPERDALLGKGVLAEYLAWWLVAAATRGGGGSLPDLPTRN